MIEVKHLTKSFGRFTAVNDVSFQVNDGETFALLGPNGSGKTTTLKCMVGLSAPTKGEIAINGFDLRHGAREAKRLISFLPQRLSFHENLTAREVMKFYCDLRKLPSKRIDDVLNNSHFDFNGFCFGTRPMRGSRCKINAQACSACASNSGALAGNCSHGDLFNSSIGFACAAGNSAAKLT